MAGIDAKTDRYFDRFIELRKAHQLYEVDRLAGLVRLPEFAALTRAAILLPVLCHENQSLTTMPMERAAPAIMAIALSIESQLRSGIFTVASFSSCAFVIVPTFTLFG